MRALIDGDVIAYRAGFACEKVVYLVEVSHYPERRTIDIYEFKYKKDALDFVKENGGEIRSSRTTEPVENAYYIVKRMIDHVLHTTNSTDYCICLSGHSNYRSYIDPEYKANRSPDAKPIYLDNIKNFIKENYTYNEQEYVEADDLLGIAQSEDFIKHDGLIDQCRTVICTIDKDLDMIAGHHYNFVTGEKYWIDQEDADYFFWKQMLTGDKADNIQGIRGIGPKKADKLLLSLDPSEYELCVRLRYAEEFIGEGMGKYEKNKQLLWIHRSWQELERNVQEAVEGTQRRLIGASSVPA